MPDPASGSAWRCLFSSQAGVTFINRLRIHTKVLEAMQGTIAEIKGSDNDLVEGKEQDNYPGMAVPTATAQYMAPSGQMILANPQSWCVCSP